MFISGCCQGSDRGGFATLCSAHQRPQWRRRSRSKRHADSTTVPHDVSPRSPTPFGRPRLRCPWSRGRLPGSGSRRATDGPASWARRAPPAGSARGALRVLPGGGRAGTEPARRGRRYRHVRCRDAATRRGRDADRRCEDLAAVATALGELFGLGAGSLRGRHAARTASVHAYRPCSAVGHHCVRWPSSQQACDRARDRPVDGAGSERSFAARRGRSARCDGGRRAADRPGTKRRQHRATDRCRAAQPGRFDQRPARDGLRTDGAGHAGRAACTDPRARSASDGPDHRRGSEPAWHGNRPGHPTRSCNRHEYADTIDAEPSLA